MRTTLDLDDDILAAARELARAEGRSMGQVISGLARRGLTAPTASVQGGFGEAARAFAIDEWPTMPIGKTLVTNEAVLRLLDELDEQDATAWDHQQDAPRDFSKSGVSRSGSS